MSVDGYESVESTFCFARYIHQGSVKAPKLWLEKAMQILGDVEAEWVKKKIGVLACD